MVAAMRRRLGLLAVLDGKINLGPAKSPAWGGSRPRWRASVKMLKA